MRKKNYFSTILFLLFLFHACPTKAQDFEIKCIGTELDGSMTLRVSGKGRNKFDAIAQAKKNAIFAVLFEGVRNGVEGANQRPLVTGANAREKFADYFDCFYQDGGEYKDYVNMADRRLGTTEKIRGGNQVEYAITVRVLRSKLKSKLKSDGIIK